MHVRTARSIVRVRRLARTHRTTARAIGAAGLAGALLLGGVSIAAADPGADGSADQAASAAASPAADAADAAADAAADPGTVLLDEQGNPMDPGIGDDEDVAPDAVLEAEMTPEELATVIAQQDAELEERAQQAETKVKAKKVRSRIIEIAKDQIGDRYVPGRSGPDGFDCSGLVRYVFKQAMGKELPHQSRAQYGKVERISVEEAQPGDLVFFFRNGAHHVGIYIGKGKMIDAPGRGHRVRVSPITGSWWGRTFTGMGRIVDPV